MDVKIGKKGETCKVFHSPHVFLPFEGDLEVAFGYLGRVGGGVVAAYDTEWAMVWVFLV